MDKAYIDFRWLYELNLKDIFFVTRAKDNMDYDVIGEYKEAKNKNIISDLIIKLIGPQTSIKYPDKLRMVEFWDQETDDYYYFITNNFYLAVSTIVQIYKPRWQIELFFRWIKQNLKIKKARHPCR